MTQPVQNLAPQAVRRSASTGKALGLVFAILGSAISLFFILTALTHEQSSCGSVLSPKNQSGWGLDSALQPIRCSDSVENDKVFAVFAACGRLNQDGGNLGVTRRGSLCFVGVESVQMEYGL